MAKMKTLTINGQKYIIMDEKAWSRIGETEQLATEDKESLVAAVNGAMDRFGGARGGKELTESWAELQARIKVGDTAGIHVGDYKIIQLSSGETVRMEVAGVDTYYGVGRDRFTVDHHVDFISDCCVGGPRVFNTSNHNNGNGINVNPWAASSLYRELNTNSGCLLSKLPEELQACIIPKKVYGEHRYSSSGLLSDSIAYVDVDMGKLWLPTEVEVFGHFVYSGAPYAAGTGQNVQYPIFRGNANKFLKYATENGDQTDWWLASPAKGHTAWIAVVTYHGMAGIWSAGNINANCRVPICFRIG